MFKDTAFSFINTVRIRVNSLYWVNVEATVNTGNPQVYLQIKRAITMG